MMRGLAAPIRSRPAGVEDTWTTRCCKFERHRARGPNTDLGCTSPRSQRLWNLAGLPKSTSCNGEMGSGGTLQELGRNSAGILQELCKNMQELPIDKKAISIYSRKQWPRFRLWRT